MEKLKGVAKSRKFWAAVVGLAFVVLKSYVPKWPLDETQTVGIVGLAASYIIGTGLESSAGSGGS